MNQEKDRKYDDIIHLPHPVSKRHPQMPLENRAAQFSPFAALTGHGAAIREAARLTEDLAELDEDRKDMLDKQLRQLKDELADEPEIEVVCFQPDQKKSGGHYTTIRGKIKKIDEYRRLLLFVDGTAVPAGYILSLERI